MIQSPHPATLRELQSKFVLMVADFIQWAYANDYEFTFGEAWRTPEQAAWNAAHGKGIGDSLHTQRLAIDLNLFLAGIYQMETSAYRPLGDYWKAMGGSWGGDFARPDGNHFSLAYGGRRVERIEV